MRYAFIERHRKVWPVAAQCRALNVNASGFHQYRARQRADAGSLQTGRRISDTALLVHIKAIFHETKGAYGWPRVWRELLARGVRAGRERVRKLMKAHGLPSGARQTQVHGDDEQFSSASRLVELAGARILRRSAQPCPDRRHHLPVDGGRLDLSRGCHRSVQPSDRRLLAKRAHDAVVGH